MLRNLLVAFVFACANAPQRLSETAASPRAAAPAPQPAATAPAQDLPKPTTEALGDVAVEDDGERVIFDAGEWRSEVASRRNDDGTLSYFTITPGESGFEFVVAERDGKRALILRDGQQEYVLLESRQAASRRVPSGREAPMPTNSG